jgi:hypothetical protein
MSAAARFTAEAFGFAPPASIDRERGIVYGARALARESRNGRVYPARATESAVALYGAPCNLGHHFDTATGLPGEVPPEKRFGRHTNPRADERGIITDFRFNPEHAFAKPFLWAVEHDPAQLCFSHLARVQWAPKRDNKGRQVAESILEVASIDLVTDGGTTSTIFESLNRKQWVSEMELKAADVVSQMETDGAVIAFLTDMFSELKGKVTDQATRDMIVSMVTAAMSGAAEPPADAAPPEEAMASPAMEALKRTGAVGQWAARKLASYFAAEALARREKWARDLITAEAVPAALVSDVFVSTVAESMNTPDRAKALIADRKRLGAPTGGAQHSPRGTGAALDLKALAAGWQG